MRYLAIDYGLKRLGLAVCDAEEIIVSPLCMITNAPKTLEQLANIIQENQIEAIVMGLPLNMDDSEGPQAKCTREFSKQLLEMISIPLHFQDERLSSAAADDLLADSGLSFKKRKEKRDMLAACDILQEFLYHNQQDAPS
jgi:putative Holliday junction resolvase